MATRDLRYLGDPVLRERCDEVEEFDEELGGLIDDLFETMYAEDGIGLAAPQVGVLRRVFVYDIRDPEVSPGVLVNPRIVDEEGSVRDSEGCLSIPELTEVVERAERVVVEGLDRNGDAVRLEADGLLSRCLQHERDHLDGVLFIDRISPLKRKMLLKKWSRMQEGVGTAASSRSGR